MGECSLISWGSVVQAGGGSYKHSQQYTPTWAVLSTPTQTVLSILLWIQQASALLLHLLVPLLSSPLLQGCVCEPLQECVCELLQPAALQLNPVVTTPLPVLWSSAVIRVFPTSPPTDSN